MRFIATLRSYKYEIVAFLTGASVMILEIVGARLIAPQFGTSTYVWTAMIGVILGSLALGYAIGGKLADRYHNPRFIARILFGAALLILFVAFVQEPVLETIAAWNLDLRLSALLAAVLLFGPPSALIGMVSPHLAKIRITSLETSGLSVGRLEAAGALGSIAGTFACGYFLLGWFGSRSLVIGIVVILLITSFIVDPVYKWKHRLAGFAAAGLMLLLTNINHPSILADVDSSYARYQVVAGSYGPTPATMLLMDRGGIQSAVPSDGSDEILFSYTQRFKAAYDAYGQPRKVLVVGGGAHTFPSYLIRSDPDVLVDVAEIDPALEQIAKDHFYFKESPRLTLHHTDGRTYLNDSQGNYDMVYMDAFSSMSPPFQLTTAEAVQGIQRNLSDDGVVVVNLIGTYDGGNGEYLRAMKATYESVFDHVSVRDIYPGAVRSERRQNFTMVASNDKERYDAVAGASGDALNFNRGPALVLTDNYAPIERLTF